MYVSGKYYYVYFMTNYSNKVLYVGVTNNLIRRAYEHKNHCVEGFTDRYNVVKLVYFEVFENIEEAISREKSVKNLVRRKKNDLVNKNNPYWKDLYNEII